MPADFVIDVHAGVVFTKGAGVLGRDDVLQHNARLIAHPDFRPQFSQLMDVSAVSKIEISVKELEQLTIPTVFERTSRRAILVASDLQYGVGRMTEVFSEMNGQTGVRVFRDAQEAFAFLGIDGVPPADAFTRLVSLSHA